MNIKEEMPSEFEKELTALINRHSMENGSNTPDFILASYLRSCLDNFNRVSRWRERWYGKELSIGGIKDKDIDAPQELPPTEPPTLSGLTRVCNACGALLNIVKGAGTTVEAWCPRDTSGVVGIAANEDKACDDYNSKISSPAPRPVATDACADPSPVSGTQDESASPAPSRGDVSSVTREA